MQISSLSTKFLAITGALMQVDAQIKGKKIRVQLELTDFLHLAEVVVIDTNGNNVAYHKNASQSSVYERPNGPGLPEYGVDGSTETFFHTDSEYQPWWEVDLGSVYSISRVEVYNREQPEYTYSQTRLSYSNVSIHNELGAVVGTYHIGNVEPTDPVLFNITAESFTRASPQSIMSKYTHLDADFAFTEATIDTSSSSSFEFNFTNTIAGSKINAAIVALAPCNSNNSAFEIKDGATSGSIIGSEVSGTSTATIRRNIESDINTKKGTIILDYCLRADLYDTSDDSFSIGAKKVNLHLNITYETEGRFSISSIQTSEFTGANINSGAIRSITISVFKDTCSGCKVVAGDADGCFTTDKLVVGGILALCLQGDATDVELIGLKSATVQAGQFSSPVVSSVVTGGPGDNNFVTSTTVMNGEVTLQTLLLPAYYDALNGGANGFITVSGTALVSYISPRHLNAAGRMLQEVTEESSTPFAIEIPLVENDIPFIAHADDASSAIKFGAGMAVLVGIGGVVVM